ncbi:MAG: carboxymuconolactone decarboxylase family protein [Bacteroidota bacterium]
MKCTLKNIIRKMSLVIPVLLITATLSAQDNVAYEQAKKEITQTFGTFLTMFDAFPEHALAGAWETFKQLQSPENAIAPKNRELIRLAVASQIPCVYCVYFHTVSAKAFGATDAEIEEAVAHGGQTRHWSMILQGTQIKFEEFKAEMDAAMKYKSENSGK